MKKYVYLSFIMSGLLTTSCNDYLDVVPKSDVKTIESQFEQKTDVDTWLRTCYVMFTDMATQFHINPGYLGADEFVGGQFAREVQGPNSTSTSHLFLSVMAYKWHQAHIVTFGKKTKHIVSSDIVTSSWKMFPTATTWSKKKRIYGLLKSKHSRQRPILN